MGDSENIVGTEWKKNECTAQIPRETVKTVSFIEDIVYAVLCCNRTLTFLPIPGSPQGKIKPTGGSV